ncbi:MAG TPA: hypothetical protein VGC41_26740 [Kofleriaceae bacterium]
MIPADVRSLPMRGKFEAHITVAGGGDLEPLCKQLGVDYVAIELASGVHASQPMTASHHEGVIADVVDEVNALAARIAAAGFVITRTKLEAEASSEGVPLGEHDGYFEFHVKVRVAGREAELVAIAAAHGARLSRNNRRANEDGRFVTMRVYRLGRVAAEEKLAALLEALAGFAVVGIAREFTVYDSRVELDAGWLEPT